MAQKNLRTDVKIFVASSNEVITERKETILVMSELNKKFNQLHLECVEYEYDTPTGNQPNYARMQDRFNELLDDCDIVLVLFYSKAGLFTLEEFKKAKENNKKIFLYFKEGFVPKTTKDAAAYGALLKLKEDIEEEGLILYQIFDSPTNFNGILYKDMHKYLTDNSAMFNEVTESTAGPVNIPVVNNSTVLLYDGSVGMKEKYFRGNEGRIYKKVDGKDVPVTEKGLGKLKFENGVLSLTRYNTEGRFEIWISTYNYFGEAKQYISKQNGKSTLFEISFEAMVAEGEHNLVFVFKGVESGNWLNKSLKKQISEKDWTKIELSCWVDLKEDCQLRIDDQNITDPGTLRIRNFMLSKMA